MRLSNLIASLENATIRATKHVATKTEAKLANRRERSLDERAEELAEIQRRANIILSRKE